MKCGCCCVSRASSVIQFFLKLFLFWLSFVVAVLVLFLCELHLRLIVWSWMYELIGVIQLILTCVYFMSDSWYQYSEYSCLITDIGVHKFHICRFCALTWPLVIVDEDTHSAIYITPLCTIIHVYIDLYVLCC